MADTDGKGGFNPFLNSPVADFTKTLVSEQKTETVAEDEAKPAVKEIPDPVKLGPYEVVLGNIFEETNQDYDLFDERAWSKGDGYKSGFPIFDEKLEGLDEGLYVLGAESNVGKSAILANLLWGYAMNEDNKLFGVYFSLDDSRNELIPRFIAMNQGIPINVASKPQRYQSMVEAGAPNSSDYVEMLQKRSTGIQQLKDASRKFKIVDSETINCGEKLVDYCIKLQEYVKSFDPDMNIIVGIDSLADIQWPSQNFRAGDENAVVSFTARQIKSLAVDVLHCPIFGTYHLRKIDQTKRPNIADMKSSGTLIYEASAIFLAHNDVGRNQQNAAIYWTLEGNSELQPVIEFHWAKNKKSTFKGRTYFDLIAGHSKILEATQEEMQRYDSLIYSSR